MRTPAPEHCTAPARLDEAALTNGTRHTCAVLRHACLFNATIVPFGGSPTEEQRAAAAAQRIMVRNIFNSHSAPFPLKQLHPMRPARPGTAAAKLLAQEVEARGFSPCVPLVWRPVWAFNFGEQFANTLSPLHELQAAMLVDDRLLLRPDLAAAARPSWYQPLFGAFSQHPLASLREIGTRCLERDAQLKLSGEARNRFQKQRCEASCHERVLVCGFESLLDTHQHVPPAFAPWRAAQWVAAHVARTDAPAPAAPPAAPPAALRVLFVNRTQTLNQDRRGRRRIANLAQLLELCAGWARVRCEAHEFGRHGLAADVRAVRSADVLVSMHRTRQPNPNPRPRPRPRPEPYRSRWPGGHARFGARQRALHAPR